MNEDCLKLTTYFGERDRTEDGLLADELMNIYGGHRLPTSILLRGAEGFGRLHHLHTDRLLSSLRTCRSSRSRLTSVIGSKSMLERCCRSSAAV